MAVEITPLGFQKPDGYELVRNGDNAISANAAKSQELHASAQGRLGAIESKNSEQDGRLNSVESKNATQDARLANLDNAAGFTGDPLSLNDAAFAETLTNGTATSAALDVRLTARVPPIVAAAIATDPTIAASAATMAQNTAGLIPAWKASTAYVANQRVIAPNGDVVAAKVNFTSGASYLATNWNASTQDGRIGAVEAKNAAQDATLVGEDIIRGKDARVLRDITDSTYAIPFADKDGYVAGGFRQDGTFNVEKPSTVLGEVGISARPISAPGWAEVHTDKDGYVSHGVRSDGTFVAYKSASSSTLQQANDALGYSRSSKTRVATLGDSLTAGYDSVTGNWAAGQSWPAQLQTLVPAGVTIFNRGIAGWTVDEIAIEVGAFPFDVTVVGGTIPATGPVDLTTAQTPGWTGSSNIRSFHGSLAGIPGTIRKNDGNALIFTRTTDGTAKAVSGLQRFTANWDVHRSDTLIIFIGRNDVSNNVIGGEANVVDHVVAGTQRLVDYLTVDLKQVLLVGTITKTSETSGSAGYNTVTAINAALAAKYGPRFTDVRRYLIDKAIYDLGITPTTADLAAIAADTLPPSIMADDTHYNQATAALLASKVFNPYLQTRGWLTP